MCRTYIGIDPGASGALSVIFTKDGIPFKVDTREFKHSNLDGYIQALSDIKDVFSPISKVIVEQVHAMPGQGVTSVFTFGKNFGEILGALKALGIGYELVPPQKWQKELGVTKPTATKAERKKAISERVIAIYPETGSLIRGPKGGYKDGVADAFGLAHYAFKIYK